MHPASLELFPFRWNRNGALDSCFDAFSSREPVSTSLENALVPWESLRRPDKKAAAALFPSRLVPIGSESRFWNLVSTRFPSASRHPRLVACERASLEKRVDTKMAPLMGPSVLHALLLHHVMHRVMMVMMHRHVAVHHAVVHFILMHVLRARDRGDGKRQGSQGGQHNSNLPHHVLPG
jgi:hypothetical protein